MSFSLSTYKLLFKIISSIYVYPSKTEFKSAIINYCYISKINSSYKIVTYIFVKHAVVTLYYN